MRASSPPASVLRHPDFRRVWAIGAALALLRWLDTLVLGVFVYELTGSASKVALVFFFRMAPQLLLGLFIGTLADSINRKTMLLVSMFILALIAASLTLLIANDHITYWYLTAAVCISGVFTTSDLTVRRALIADLVPAQMVARAIGVDIATANLMRVLGPVLGGVLLQTVGAAGAFGLAAGLYTLATLAALTIRYRQPPRARRHSPLTTLTEGIRHIRTREVLVSVLAVTVLMNLCGIAYISMIPAIGVEILGADALRIGLLSSLEGCGAALGSLWLANRASAYHYPRIFFYGSALFLLCILSFSLSQLYSLSALLLLCGGFGLAGFSTMQTTLLVTHSDPAMRGRVLGALALCIGAQPLGALQVAALVQIFSPQTTVLIITLEGLLALAGAGLLWPLLRRGNLAG